MPVGSCGSWCFWWLLVLHAFHAALLHSRHTPWQAPSFSREQGTGRQPSMPVPENQRFRSKGDSMIRCFQRRRRDCCCLTRGLLCPGTKQHLDWLILSCWRPVLGVLGYWAASLAPTLQVPGVSPAPRCGNQKCPLVVLRVPFGTKSPLIENYYLIFLR